MTRCLAFFGAFNPPTLAHVELARRAMILSGRECVLFVPSKSGYITDQQGKDYAFTDEERLEMLFDAMLQSPAMSAELIDKFAEKLSARKAEL